MCVETMAAKLTAQLRNGVSAPRLPLLTWGLPSWPSQPGSQNEIILDMKHINVQWSRSHEVIFMIDHPIKALNSSLRPGSGGVADLARQDRAGLVIKPCH